MPSPKVTVKDLRDKYLRFFESKGHLIHDSGSLIPFDVTGKLDESLLFNGAGMVQFKPYFRGVATPPKTRLTTAQKCVRTGDIDEVGDDSHLTFFEMLGNFSFGDYFRKEAIAYSWEFLTSPVWLALDPKKLSFTVFKEDQEAFDCWAALLTTAGIDPQTRIFKLDDETNYWPAGSFTKGPPGPCGPNSEMFYWQGAGDPPSAPYSAEDWLQDDANKNWLEIWNDVFIQYEWQGTEGDNGWIKTGMPNLPFNSIDTGMGIERTVAVLNGFKSVYDTDAFTAIFAKIDSLQTPLATHGQGEAPVTEEGTSESGTIYNSAPENNEQTTAARRIIADHIRTACFCIADGILPANNGRGYVLRRLIRRAVLKGQRTLGFNELFMHQVAEAVIETFGDHYKTLTDQQQLMLETLKNEEALFRKTLHRGVEQLEGALLPLLLIGTRDVQSFDTDSVPELIARMVFDRTYDADSIRIATKDFSGENSFFTGFRKLFQVLTAQNGSKRRLSLEGDTAFQLYDTFGFPLEVTQELCAEAGITIDLDGFNKAMQEAQERSRGAQGDKSAYGALDLAEDLVVENSSETTTFTGYKSLVESTKIERVRVLGEKHYQVATRETPLYAESGGQTGDSGSIQFAPTQFGTITTTTKSGGLIWHEVREHEVEKYLGAEVRIAVDVHRRRKTQRHHTATHLLQASLRHHLGTGVNQAGSYNGPDNLRFDFTHGKALSQEEIQRVEQTVNEEILRNTDVITYADLPIAEAKAKGAMALFGEKYGDKVRMVEIGEFSKELCGGTHVRTTGEIGLFKIVSENSAASGVRRIEAVCGEAAYALVNQQQSDLKEAAGLLKTNPKELVQAIEKTLDQLKDERKKREKAEMAAMSGETTQTETTVIKGIALWVKNFGDADQKVASQAIDNEANGKPNQVTLGVVVGEKITFMCKVGEGAQAKGAHAGNILREVAKIAGGGGGGQAAFATAGGRDATKVEEALSAATEILAAQIS